MIIHVGVTMNKATVVVSLLPKDIATLMGGCPVIIPPERTGWPERQIILSFATDETVARRHGKDVVGNDER